MKIFKIILIYSTLFLTSIASAEAFHCKVVSVQSGDSITCITIDQHQYTVDLYQIEIPNNQAFAKKSKQALSDMILGQDIRVIGVRSISRNKNEKIVGAIYYMDGGRCMINPSPTAIEFAANLEMIKCGYARYKPSQKISPLYQKIEQEAKEAKRGLWSQPHLFPPD